MVSAELLADLTKHDDGEDQAAAPEPLSKGRYSIYETPDGGYHLAYRPDGADEDGHMQIPAAIVRMAKAGAGGQGTLGRLKAMFG